MQHTVAALLNLQKTLMTTEHKKISQDQYQRWKKKLVFDRLRGLRAGQSFCNQFDITDNILYYESLEGERFFQYIEENYIQ